MKTPIKKKVWYCFIINAVWLVLQPPFFTCAIENAANEEQIYLQAVQLYNQKDWNQAKILFERLQKEFPKSRWEFAVHLRLADMESNPQKAISSYNFVIRNAAKTEWEQDAHWGLANLLYSLAKYPEAINEFSQIIDTSGERYIEARFLMGLSQLCQKDYSGAKKTFIEINEIFEPTKWMKITPLGLGEAEIGLKNLTEAVRYFNTYLEQNPNGHYVPMVLKMKSNIIKQQGQVDAATVLLNELVTRYNDSYEAAEATQNMQPQSTELLSIQVGAFTKKEFAVKLVEKLKKQGFDSYIISASQKNDVYHQVRIGKFNSKEIAEKISKKITAHNDLPTIIVNYRAPDKSKK